MTPPVVDLDEADVDLCLDLRDFDVGGGSDGLGVVRPRGGRSRGWGQALVVDIKHV